MSWRPRNETSADLEFEDAAARVLEAKWNMQAVKLSEGLYNLDWAFFRDDALSAWGEFKRRSKRFPEGLLLSAAKWEHGCRLATMYRVPFIVVVQWPDGLYWMATYGDRHLQVVRGGSNRGQNGDKEPCVIIPDTEFKRIAD